MKKKPKQKGITIYWRHGVAIGIVKQKPVLWFYDHDKNSIACPMLLDGQEYSIVDVGSSIAMHRFKWTATAKGWNYCPQGS